ncbi:hypothetical protein HK100_005779 [Physocladia obscura]|uniref:Aminopeptidase P N-terminal domain-containing protein n=1 Tax=Physocladia obscura TaxID=109957 RepID=A0AAD5XIR7_9FUNG|nr:hypothetical protein HK100_005779 [Physocladia obscura]
MFRLQKLSPLSPLTWKSIAVRGIHATSARRIFISSRTCQSKQSQSQETQLRNPSKQQLLQFQKRQLYRIASETIEEKEEIPAIEFALRRAQFAALLPEGSVAIVAGFTLRYATGGIFHEFHQNTDLLYLTGFNEPDAAMLLEKDTAKFDGGHRFTMFVRPKNPSTEIWDGPCVGVEDAIKEYGADEVRQLKFKYCDQAFTITKLPHRLSQILDTQLAQTNSKILTDLPKSHPLVPSPHATSSHAASAPAVPAWTPYATLLTYLEGSTPPQRPTNLYKVSPLAPVLAQLRLVKSDAEIRVLRRAGKISGRAIVDAMAATKPGVSEKYLHAVVEFSAKRRGADWLAYVPVVASGLNALTLHYVVNRGVLRDGDLVLMDAGCEYGNYASDITRTWPANGKFTLAQQQLYSAVLKTQKACIDKCTELSNVSLDDLQNIAFEVLKAECSKLFGRRLSYNDMNKLYPHHVGHWMGMDVHDVQSVSRTIKLKKNMVVTIEPGIYVPNSDVFPEQYRGIGIRIEDDIVIGHDNPTILSVEAPKEIVDIEAVCQGLVGTRD